MGGLREPVLVWRGPALPGPVVLESVTSPQPARLAAAKLLVCWQRAYCASGSRRNTQCVASEALASKA